MDDQQLAAVIGALPDSLLFKVLLMVDFKTRMAAQCVCKRWQALPRSYPELLQDPVFVLTRPDSVVDQEMMDDCATWLLEHGQHVTSLALSAYPPAERGEGKFPSWRESQLWVTTTACLAACPRLAALALRWHEDIDLSHHFRLLRQLTGLTAVSDSGIKPGMLTGHTSLRALCLKAFTLSQGTHPDEFLPPRLTRLHLDVDPDKLPSQLLVLSELSVLSLHRLDPHRLYRQELVGSYTLLGRLTQLVSFELAHSHLPELPPGLSALTGLTYLGLRDTHWRAGDLGAVLAPLTRLRALDISCQELPSLPEAVAALGELRALAVAGGQFALPQGPYTGALEHLEVDLEWLERDAEDLAHFPCLRSLCVSGLGGPSGESLPRRKLAELLAPAQRLARLVLAAEGGGVLPLSQAAHVWEFGRARPAVGVVLCVQGQQPSPAAALEAGW